MKVNRNYHDNFLASYLKEKAEKIERGNITDEEMIKLYKMYISETDSSIDTSSIDNTAGDDPMKYIFMGWYVYTMIGDK